MANDASAAKDHSYDAIVVGTGISGGWAAKELTEKGLKTLVLDRGRDGEARRVSDRDQGHLGASLRRPRHRTRI